MALWLLILLGMSVLLVTEGALVNESISYNISLGSKLTTYANSSWLSPSGLFAFGFYQEGDGYFVGIWLTSKPKITVVWTANRDDPPVSSNSTIELTEDGWFLLHSAYGKKNITEQVDAVTSASMFDSGNFVLYDHSEVLWESFDYPCDTILGGQNLTSEDQLVFLPGNKKGQLVSCVSDFQHSSGRFVLSMQYDGNLVAYPQNSSMLSNDSYWSTATYSTRYESLNLNYSGALYMVGVDETQRVIYQPNRLGLKNNERVVYRATLNPQGNFVLYAHVFTTSLSKSDRMMKEWAALQDPCKAKGICGANSYCSNTADDTKCYCFPGFSPFNNTSNVEIFGCNRDFTDEEACSQTGLGLFYNITELENIELEVLYPYSVMNLSKQNCSKSCLDDCECWASLYANDSCKKLKDPIMYARLDNSSSARVLIKVKDPLTTSTNRTQRVVVERTKLVSILAVTLGLLALLCTLMAISSFIFYRVHSHRYQSMAENVDFGFIGDHVLLRSFSFDELQKATDDFKEVIGRNSIGEVYKGFISEGKKAVAVKRLDKVYERGGFRAEITAIAQTHHRNLVRLLGFCIHGGTKLLVYEFMSNGSLADLLLNSDAKPSWENRVRVVQDVARGILYLHEECEASIIHCNIKPHNVLFDESWNAKISDFGLSKLLRPNQSGTLTSLRGTRGYLAPEWFKNTLISTKVDIYSFGVVLLEILCCTIDTEIDILSDNKKPLFTWVYNCFADDRFDRLIGDEEVDIYMIEKMVKVGLLCIQEDSDARPSIKDVILMLEGTTHIPIPPSPIPLVIF